jgi:hypothetical protein
MTLRSSRHLIEMSSRIIPVPEGCQELKAGKLTAICETTFLESVRTSTSHQHIGVHSLFQAYSLLNFRLHLKHTHSRVKYPSTSFNTKLNKNKIIFSAPSLCSSYRFGIMSSSVHMPTKLWAERPKNCQHDKRVLSTVSRPTLGLSQPLSDCQQGLFPLL